MNCELPQLVGACYVHEDILMQPVTYGNIHRRVMSKVDAAKH